MNVVNFDGIEVDEGLERDEVREADPGRARRWGDARTRTKLENLPDLEPVVRVHQGGIVIYFGPSVDVELRRHLCASERQSLVESLARRLIRELWDAAMGAANAQRSYEHERRLRLRR